MVKVMTNLDFLSRYTVKDLKKKKKNTHLVILRSHSRFETVHRSINAVGIENLFLLVYLLASPSLTTNTAEQRHSNACTHECHDL